ncbi:MAG TPA: hypothetical protein VGD94_06995 [Vicinamibacterales bacterium]
MDKDTVSRDRLDLRDDPAVISPPIVHPPVYACATARRRGSIAPAISVRGTAAC